MLCSLSTSDAVKARDVFSQMSASERLGPSTQYLLYKVALSSRDLELGNNVLPSSEIQEK